MTVSSIFCISIFCLLSSKGRSALSKSQKKTAGYYEQQLSYAVEITHANITSNFADWDTDMAIVFYAPWCKYCKQLSPSWEQIAAATSTKKDLVVGKFNCETPAENVQFCQKVGVDRYPSIYFMGYGNLQQAPAGKPFAANPQPRIARYVADLYPEAIYDWVRMCAQISTMQRWWDDFKSIYTGKSRSAKKLQTLKSKVLPSQWNNYCSEKGTRQAFRKLPNNYSTNSIVFVLKGSSIRERCRPLCHCAGSIQG